MKKISKGVFLAAAGAVVLVLQAFGVMPDAPYVNEIIEAVCAILIVLGIVATAKPKEDNSENNDAEKSDVEKGSAENAAVLENDGGIDLSATLNTIKTDIGTDGNTKKEPPQSL